MKRRIFCFAALLLAACGESGPLYLPDQAPPKSHNPLKKEQRRTQNPQAEPATTVPPDAPADPASAAPSPAPAPAPAPPPQP